MAKVYAIYEDNHGFIGVATTPAAAAYWLVSSGWICSKDEFFVEEDCIAKPIEEVVPNEYEGDWKQWIIDNTTDDYENFLPLMGFQLDEEELQGEVADLTPRGRFG